MHLFGDNVHWNCDSKDCNAETSSTAPVLHLIVLLTCNKRVTDGLE